jgi:hypothetical protein
MPVIFDCSFIKEQWKKDLIKSLKRSFPRSLLISTGNFHSDFSALRLAHRNNPTATIVYLSDYDCPDVLAFRHRVKKSGKAKQIAFNHGFTFNGFETPMPNASLEYERRIIASVDLMCFNSNFAYRTMQERHEVSTKNSVVLGLPVHTKFPKTVFGSRSGFLIASRFTEVKNRNLIIAFAEMCVEKRKPLTILAKNKYNKNDHREQRKIRAALAYLRYLADKSDLIWLKENAPRRTYLSCMVKASAFVGFPAIDTLNITMVEAAMAKTLPIFPNKAPYNEFIPENCLYRPYDLSHIFEIEKSVKRSDESTYGYAASFTPEAFESSVKEAFCDFIR